MESRRNRGSKEVRILSDSEIERRGSLEKIDSHNTESIEEVGALSDGEVERHQRCRKMGSRRNVSSQELNLSPYAAHEQSLNFNKTGVSSNPNQLYPNFEKVGLYGNRNEPYQNLEYMEGLSGNRIEPYQKLEMGSSENSLGNGVPQDIGMSSGGEKGRRQSLNKGVLKSGSLQKVGVSSYDEKKRPQTVLFFGKTGDGKSTLCNMLLFSDVEGQFMTGTDVGSVSQQVEMRANEEWSVIDTVGLGDALKNSQSPSKDALSKLKKFFSKTRMKVDHICFVMRKGEFTEYEKMYWDCFLELFGTHEKHIRLIFTSAGETWQRENDIDIKEMMGDYPTISVDFPPRRDDDQEDFLRKKREKNLTRLRTFLSERWIGEPAIIGRRAFLRHQGQSNKQPTFPGSTASQFSTDEQVADQEAQWQQYQSIQVANRQPKSSANVQRRLTWPWTLLDSFFQSPSARR